MILEGLNIGSSTNGMTSYQFNVQKQAHLCAEIMSRPYGTIDFYAVVVDTETGQRTTYYNGNPT